MVKPDILILGCITLATIFGIFGHGIAYFMNQNITPIAPIYYLTVLTFTSVFLYLVVAVITYAAKKRGILNKNRIDTYFTIIGFIGTPTSLWSLIVLVMWWG